MASFIGVQPQAGSSYVPIPDIVKALPVLPWSATLNRHVPTIFNDRVFEMIQVQLEKNSDTLDPFSRLNLPQRLNYFVRKCSRQLVRMAQDSPGDLSKYQLQVLRAFDFGKVDPTELEQWRLSMYLNLNSLKQTYIDASAKAFVGFCYLLTIMEDVELRDRLCYQLMFSSANWANISSKKLQKENQKACADCYADVIRRTVEYSESNGYEYVGNVALKLGIPNPQYLSESVASISWLLRCLRESPYSSVGTVIAYSTYLTDVFEKNVFLVLENTFKTEDEEEDTSSSIDFTELARPIEFLKKQVPFVYGFTSMAELQESSSTNSMSVEEMQEVSSSLHEFIRNDTSFPDGMLDKYCQRFYGTSLEDILGIILSSNVLMAYMSDNGIQKDDMMMAFVGGGAKEDPSTKAKTIDEIRKDLLLIRKSIKDDSEYLLALEKEAGIDRYYKASQRVLAYRVFLNAFEERSRQNDFIPMSFEDAKKEAEKVFIRDDTFKNMYDTMKRMEEKKKQRSILESALFLRETKPRRNSKVIDKEIEDKMAEIDKKRKLMLDNFADVNPFFHLENRRFADLIDWYVKTGNTLRNSGLTRDEDEFEAYVTQVFGQSTYLSASGEYRKLSELFEQNLQAADDYVDLLEQLKFLESEKRRFATYKGRFKYISISLVLVLFGLLCWGIYLLGAWAGDVWVNTETARDSLKTSFWTFVSNMFSLESGEEMLAREARGEKVAPGFAKKLFEYLTYSGDIYGQNTGVFSFDYSRLLPRNVIVEFKNKNATSMPIFALMYKNIFAQSVRTLRLSRELILAGTRALNDGLVEGEWSEPWRIEKERMSIILSTEWKMVLLDFAAMYDGIQEVQLQNAQYGTQLVLNLGSAIVSRDPRALFGFGTKALGLNLSNFEKSYKSHYESNNGYGKPLDPNAPLKLEDPNAKEAARDDFVKRLETTTRNAEARIQQLQQQILQLEYGSQQQRLLQSIPRVVDVTDETTILIPRPAATPSGAASSGGRRSGPITSSDGTALSKLEMRRQRRQQQQQQGGGGGSSQNSNN